jgi:hypothetical protein
MLHELPRSHNQSPRSPGPNQVGHPESGTGVTDTTAMSINTLPAGSEYTLYELRLLAERGNRAATVAGSVLVLHIAAFSTIGTLALSGLGYASTLPSAAGYVALFAATLYSGVKIGGRLIDWLDRCLAPSRLLAEARNSGGSCQDCEYSLMGLTVPRCPECGAAVALLRSERRGE